MTQKDISLQRLLRQQITQTKLKQPQALLHYMGAMQSQEFALAKWAIGLRLPGTSDAAIEADFNAGHILRTHVLRPTWHFVAPRDIRWLLQLTGPRVQAFNASMYRKQELDQALLQRCSKLIEHSLRDGNYQTRSTISKLLQKEGIRSDTIRLSCIIMYAELEGIICSGPRAGKQFTYALLDERVPPVATKGYEEALAALSLCYFTSRGPATVQDFAWWSGLAIRDARAGAATLPSSFEIIHCAGKDYIHKPLSAAEKSRLRTATFLLPDYDEYGISYKDRSALFTGTHSGGSASMFDHVVVVDGHAGGTWKQERKGKQLHVRTQLFEPYTKTQEKEVAKAVAHYLAFAAPANE